MVAHRWPPHACRREDLRIDLDRMQRAAEQWQTQGWALLEGLVPRSEIDAAYYGMSAQHVTFVSSDVRYYVRTQDYVAATTDGIFLEIDADGVTVLQTWTKNNATGIVTLT